ncbi:hypothetical protein D3C72_2069560 [compost metagenome]
MQPQPGARAFQQQEVKGPQRRGHRRVGQGLAHGLGDPEELVAQDRVGHGKREKQEAAVSQRDRSDGQRRGLVPDDRHDVDQEGGKVAGHQAQEDDTCLLSCVTARGPQRAQDQPGEEDREAQGRPKPPDG